MPEAISDTIRDVTSRILTAARMNGIVVAVAPEGYPSKVLCLGTDARGDPITPDSLFPVASITKLATALAVLRLVDRDILALDAPLAFYLPEALAARPGVTLRRLLSHTAGLPLDVPKALAPYRPGLGWTTLAQACLQTTLSQPPATRVQYSNVGYGLLALVVEMRTGFSFTEALRDLVLEPLGVEGYLGQEPPRPHVTLSGIHGRHAGTDLEPFNSPFWRALAMPWAGLLTTVEGSLRLVRAFMGQPEGFLRPKTATEARSNQTGDLGGGYIRPLIWSRCPWGLGPDIHGDKKPHWVPSAASPESFGHAGASGTLAWYDPSAALAWAIMGTRTADSGWLLRRGPAIVEAILRERVVSSE